MSDFKPKFVQTEDAASGDNIVTRYMARLDLPKEEIEELIADVQEAFGGATENRVEFWRLRSLIERGFRSVRIYTVKNKGSRDLSECCLWLLLGFNSLAHADTMAELARRLKMSKSRVNKCLRHFQANIPELPELAGQREADSVEAMRLAQLKIWHKKTT